MENGKWKIENILPAIVRLPSAVRRFSKLVDFAGLFCLCFLLSACGQLEKSKPEPFYAETAPPQVKEFRWSSGKLPKSFDPAMAAAPPETDVVRAVYEGLTDTNARTLETVPAIAVSWNAANNYRTWTFKLRRDAEWSNNERLTAADFVRSWRRLAALGEKVPHFQLLGNIAGFARAKVGKDAAKTPAEIDLFNQKNSGRNFPTILEPDYRESKTSPDTENNLQSNSAVMANKSIVEPTVSKINEPINEQKTSTPVQIEQKFGVEAVDDFTLRVTLLKPDKDFPALAAHPLFRPVYGDGAYFKDGKLNGGIVTSGAFRIENIAPDGVTLGKSENFWNKNQVELEKVRFVPMQSAEKALEAYRAGEIDALTNIDFEPLALKLLTPFDDFRRATHNALNFYEFNRDKPPFDDRRVREALAISVERERLTEDEMDNASSPAYGFSPFANGKNPKLEQNVNRAQNLLAEAGFADGENFPKIRLVVNRNDLQQRIARAVAKMWKRNLNIETEIVVKEQTDFETTRKTKDFDILRRGVVLPTTDETVNMLAVFSPANVAQTADAPERAAETAVEPDNGTPTPDVNVQKNTNTDSAADKIGSSEKAAATANARAIPEILTENEAFNQLPAIPLYFSTAYSLVKPYVHGFEINTLDAPSLKDVRIDSEWQPKKLKGAS